MKWLNHIPLFRLIVPFSLGIMWSFYNPSQIDFKTLCIVFILLILNLILLKLKAVNSKYYNRWVFGVFSTGFFFFIGLTLSNSRIEQFNQNHFSHFISTKHHPEAYIATISSEPSINPKSIKAVLEITQIKDNGVWIMTSGKCLVYFKNQGNIKLRYGDIINFLRTPTNVLPPSNFDEFDYKRYLSHHHIYQRAYLSNTDFKIISFEPISIVKEKAINWRKFLLNRYKKYGIEGEELAIISALTLGKKESLTNELKSAYSSAGAMHVLAVSGLHVGIIFLVLRFILGWMDKFKNGEAIKAVILIISIWFYAFITGLSPSVIRAATMFSFMILAVSFGRSSNIYNTLALSAFAILVYEPFMLLEVGFQLSYLAVIGIIYLHPYIYNLIEIPPGIIEKAWNITCVSISAQLVTAPLGILYFHQFPTYFLVSNLIVIPAAFLIIFTAIGFQFLSIIPFLGSLISSILYGIVFGLNMLVKGIEHLPNSLITGLDVSIIETWIMYLIIATITIWLTHYNKKFFIYCLGLIMALTISQTIEKWAILNQKEITFYDTGKQTSVEFVNGYHTLFIADTNLISNTAKMQFHVYHHRWKRGLSNVAMSHIDSNYQFTNAWELGNTRILELDNNHLFTPNQIHQFSPQILLVNTYKNYDLSDWKGFTPKPIIIIGGKASKKVSQQIKLFCVKNEWEHYSSRENGSIKIALNPDFKPEEISYQKPH